MLTLLLLCPSALAWGHHVMMTDRALDPAGLAWLDAPVQVTSVEALLEDAGPALAQAIQAHQAWLSDRQSERFRPQRLPAQGATRADLWRALRLNPRATLPLVLRRPPGAGPTAGHGFQVAPEAASPYLHEVDGLQVRIEVVAEGALVPARAVFTTFVDEPDWGFDHELWGHVDYGYGEQPYGKPTGESSKAPFHMQFDHENFLTVAFSDAEEGLVADRIDLFLRLSRAAFGEDQDYWGLRFAAWAAHYAQDLTQPYHSRAIPGVGFGWYLGYVASPAKDRIISRMTQLEANRHFVYEDFVATAMQAGYLGQDATARTLALALASQGEELPQALDAQGLVDAVTGPAARHARAIDRALVAAFPSQWMDDPAVDVETAADYDIRALVAQAPDDTQARLLVETGQDFAQAGRATRAVLRLVGARQALSP